MANLQFLSDGSDLGDIVASGSAPIYPADDLEAVMTRAEELCICIFREGLDRIMAGETELRPQSEPQERPIVPPAAPMGVPRAGDPRPGGVRRWARVPLRVIKAIAYHVMLWTYCPVRDLIRTFTARHPVRIFTFHRVTALCRDGMTVAQSVFADQVDYLTRTHRVAPLDEAVHLALSGARLRRPVAAITFDDGYRNVLDFAYPILAERGLVATCFLSTGLVSTDRRFDHDLDSPIRKQLQVMEWSDVETLEHAGWTIGAHTVNHARVSELDAGQLRHELAAPLKFLENRGGRQIFLAYPFGLAGDVSPEAITLAEELGYAGALMDCGGDAGPDSARFRLPRIELGGDHPTYAWKAYARGVVLRRST